MTQILKVSPFKENWAKIQIGRAVIALDGSNIKVTLKIFTCDAQNLEKVYCNEILLAFPKSSLKGPRCFKIDQFGNFFANQFLNDDCVWLFFSYFLTNGSYFNLFIYEQEA